MDSSISLYDALVRASISPERAKAAVLALQEDVKMNVAASIETQLNGPIALMAQRIDARFDQITSRFDARFEEINSRFDARFEEINSRFDARFEEITSRFEARFEQIDARFEQIDGRLQRLEGLPVEIAELRGQYKRDSDRATLWRWSVGVIFALLTIGIGAANLVSRLS